MNGFLVRAASAAALSLGIAGFAQASPFYFDFAGTVLGTGAAVSGGFNFESDRLVPIGPNGSQYDFLDWQPAGLTEPLALVNIDGQTVSIPKYASNYDMVTFIESCPASCSPLFGEYFSLAAYTGDIWPADGTGTVRNESISIFAFGEPGVDYFNGATATPLDVVSLPLHNLLGSYYQNVATCEAGNCTYTDTQIQFEINTVTRGVGPRPVPEPGTLGLLGVGLAGLFFVRRRTTSALPQ